MLIDSIWDGVGAAGLCAAAGAASFITFIGGVTGVICGLVAAALAVGAYGLSHIDDAGHNRGIYFDLELYHFQWWWFGWHYRWTPYFGYVWHQ